MAGSSDQFERIKQIQKALGTKLISDKEIDRILRDLEDDQTEEYTMQPKKTTTTARKKPGPKPGSKRPKIATITAYIWKGFFEDNLFPKIGAAMVFDKITDPAHKKNYIKVTIRKSA